MLPDFESGRLEVASFDINNGLHIFQTPYVNLECLNGLTFNVVATTKVYLKVQAVLKRKNDPDNTPIYFVKEYQLDTYEASISDDLKAIYKSLAQGYKTLPPYSNCTELPLYVSDKTIGGKSYNSNEVEMVDNAITTTDWIIIPATAQNVVFKPGGSITLGNGFEARAGCDFTATINRSGFNLTCGASQTEGFQYPGNCYNSSITALRTGVTNTTAGAGAGLMSDEELQVYPVPSTRKIVLAGLPQYKQASVSVVDQSGRVVKNSTTLLAGSTGNTTLDLSALNNGIYFIKIQTPLQIISKKIVISK